MANGRDIAELAAELYEALVGDDVEISGIMEALEEGSATYREAERYASLLGQYSGTSIWDAYQELTGMLPTGETFDYDLLSRALRSRAKGDYDRIIDYVRQMQDNLNYRAGLSMNAIVPEYSESRVDNLLWKLTAAPGETEKFRDLLEAAVQNMAMSVVDESVNLNAGAQYEAGLRPTITRTMAGGACVWCRRLAGTYDYSTRMSKEVFRRHQRCQCIVTYDPGSGRRFQDVWSKQWAER